MNTLGRDERPGVKHGLHMYRALPMGIHLVWAGGLDTGLEYVDSLPAHRRDERSLEVMGLPEMQRCRLEGERPMSQLTAVIRA